MMKASWRRQWRLQLLYLFLCVGSELVFASGAPKNNGTQKPGNFSPLRMDIQQRQVVLDNGLIRVTLSNPSGMVTQITYRGIPNILDVTQRESQRGYWDLVWTTPGQPEGVFYQVEGISFQVIAQNEDKIELSFKQTYSPSSGSSLPLNLDKRFVMLSGQSGFYSYAIYERLKGWPALDIGETRLAFKLDKNLFRYMAIADDTQRFTPTAQDRLQGQRLAYPEAVLLKYPSKQGFKEEVDDKYQYSLNNEDNRVHGWVSTDQHVGFWVIIPSFEFKTGGPVKQELTSHVGPTSLAVFHSRHYAGETLKGLSFEKGEPWKKVFGPVFIYLNSGPKNAPPSSLWNDAKQQSMEEIQKWPYKFPMSPDFPNAKRRGTVTGRILISDRFLKLRDAPVPANVGLAAPGAPGSWQMAAKGYQFWSRTDTFGGFTISNVRAGNYSLYAWFPGIFGDYKYESDIVVAPGAVITLHDVIVFVPPRNGPTIWEIGIPDRKAAEFFVPDPAPGLVNPVYINNRAERYRQYGLWDRYKDLYPDRDLIFRIGVNNYQKDWFFAHVTRRTANNTYIPTIWQISFDLEKVDSTSTYTLRLALASASLADIQVRINHPSRRFDFSTNLIGTDNAIARHGIHGLYWAFSFDIPGNKLVVGTNSIFLRQARGGHPLNGAMYDYLRLEGPAE